MVGRDAGDIGPPRAAERILERLLPSTRAGEAVLGDLAEEFSQRVKDHGRKRANGWYWRQVVSIGARALVAGGGKGGTGMHMSGVLHDVRFGTRSLRKNPGFTAVVVLTLGLGIGANSAIFSVIHGVLLKPLPYADGDRLVYLQQPQEVGARPNMLFSVHDIQDLRARTRSLESVAEYHGLSFTLLGHGEAELVRVGVVSSHFFDLMGMRPILGRDFTEADDGLEAEPVFLMSYGYWQSRFGGDPAVVGEAFEMNGKMHTVIGILPPVPQHPRENDVYMPTSACPIRSAESFRENRNSRMMSVFGRMRPGVVLEDTQRDLEAVMAQMTAEYPGSYSAERGQNYGSTLLKEELVQNARPTLLILLGTAGLVLLIACANVANLALARMTKRTQELAVRSALGAGRGRLVLQLITEHTLLALAGGALGLGIAWLGTDLLIAFASRFTPRASEASMSGPVLLFTLGVSVATGLIFGGAPALTAGTRVSDHLREAQGMTGGRRSQRLQGGLVVAQLGLAFTLLVGSGLLIRSFWELQKLDPGYDSENVLSVRVSVNSRNSNMTREEQQAFFLTIRERVGALPGVLSAALTDISPMQLQQAMFHGVRPEGAEESDGTGLPQAQPRTVDVGYFETVGVPLLAGRTFTEADDDSAPLVAVVNESLAATVWPGEDPVGKRYAPCSMMGDCDNPSLTVIGVVQDVHEVGLETRPPAQIYGAMRQGNRTQNIVVRTAGDPLAIGRQVREIVAELDPTIPVSNITTLDRLRSDALSPRRLTVVLLSIFAGVAFLVSLAGIAGVIAFGVSQRTHEIGIRMALGAQRETVMRVVLGRGLRLIMLGLLMGVLGSLGLARLLSGLVWGIPVVDPVTFVGIAAVLVPLALLACYVPGRRATRIDPMVAFRAS